MSALRHRTIATALLLALVLASGCAGASTASPGGSTATVPASSTATTSPQSRGPHPTPGNEAYCDSYYHEMVVLLDGYGGLDAGGPSDPSRDAAFVTQVQRSYQLLTDTAPAPTKGDLQIVSAYLQTVHTVADVTVWSSHPDVVAAGDRNTEWVKAQCGFDPYNVAGK